METNCVSDGGCVKKSWKMSEKLQMLRLLMERRLTAAAEEIFELFERTIVEYEEEICRTKEESQQLLDSVWNPKVLIYKTDVNQLPTIKVVVPSEQQNLTPRLDPDQEDPESPHIKEEQEELCTTQEANRQFPSVPVPVAVKSEDDGEEAQSSQFHHKQTDENGQEPGGEDCEGSQSTSNFNPQGHLQTQTDEQIKDTKDSNEEWTMSQIPESQLNQKTKQMETEANLEDCGGSKPDINLVHTEDLNRTNRPFVCSVCGVRFTTKSNLRAHMRVHTGERPFSCSVCHKGFKYKNNIRFHMVIHTGEKLFCCSVCGVRFATKSNLIRHMASHTVEKPFSCSVCQKTFRQKGHVQRHMKVHSKENMKDTRITNTKDLPVRDDGHRMKRHQCPACGKRFDWRSKLETHMRIHTGEKPFKCSGCDLRFTQKSGLLSHMACHMTEKQFTCSICQKSLKRKGCLRKHIKRHLTKKEVECRGDAR